MRVLALAARRVGGLRAASHRFAAAPAVRNYATPVPSKIEDPDPQLTDFGYPDVPTSSKQYRPPRGWQDAQMRRDFDEPLHYKEEMHSMWGPDVPVVPPDQALRQFALAALGFVTFGLICKAIVPSRPAAAREYPFNGLETELGGNKARPEEELGEE